jgi:hypothetical protein
MAQISLEKDIYRETIEHFNFEMNLQLFLCWVHPSAYFQSKLDYFHVDAVSAVIWSAGSNKTNWIVS